MGVYYEIIKTNFLKYLQYPHEIAAMLVSRFIIFFFLIFFWSVTLKDSDNPKPLIFTVSYFLFATALNGLMLLRDYKLGRSIQKAIKNGAVNNYLMKPLEVIPHLFASLYVGQYGVLLMVDALYFVAGIALNPNKSLFGVLLSIPFFCLGIIISFSLNIIIACFQFYTTEAGSVRSVLSHITKILSGNYVPLFFFPSGIRNIVLSLPFASVLYAPITALQSTSLTPELKHLMFSALAWAWTLPFIALFVWNRSLRKYDAVGI